MLHLLTTMASLWPSMLNRIALAISLPFLWSTLSPAEELPHGRRTSERNIPEKLSSYLPVGLPDDAIETGVEGEDRSLLAHFAWQSFIALNWPAKPNMRNSPERDSLFGSAGKNVVWETWKSTYELYPKFGKNGLPTNWEDFSGLKAINFPAKNGLTKELNYGTDAAGTGMLPDQLRFPAASLLGGSGLPLIDLNHNFVRHETRINKISYHHVFRSRFYIKQNMMAVDPIETMFPVGSINVRAAWKQLSDDEVKSGRFYSVRALSIADVGSGKAGPTDLRVGLIGLHIVSKTAKQNDWIWFSFEHIDNLHGEQSEAGRTPSFLSQGITAANPQANKATLMTALKEDGTFPSYRERAPVSIARLNPIDPKILEINGRYQAHGQISKTVWRNYRLVGVQWPINSSRVSGPRMIGSRLTETFHPKNMSNTVLEPYTQKQSCIACHLSNRVAYNDDLITHPRIHSIDTSFPSPAVSAKPKAP